MHFIAHKNVTIARRSPLHCLVLTCVLLTGCGFFYPRQITVYDPECQILARKFVLDSVAIGGVAVSCRNEGCLIPLLPAAASAVVSGSIVIVGNAVYWLEKQGKCRLHAPHPPAAAE